MENQLTTQKVGAFGERAVEAELLRRGWVPANVNPTLKNAADYDIFAYKEPAQVQLRVKTCGPSQPGFQFGGFKPGKEILSSGFSKSDFTILVRMGKDRANDQFFVVPTCVVREQLAVYRRQYLMTPRRDGHPKKDLGHWTLYLADLKSGEDRPSYGIQRRWTKYIDNWALLEKVTNSKN